MAESTYAIVGGGVAAAAAAEALRESDPQGSIAVFTREWAPPYERPPLSKDVLQGRTPLEAVAVKPASWYAEHDVTLRTGTVVDAIDPAAGTLRAGEQSFRFRRLLLATGAIPRPARVRGADLPGVFVLRSYLDAFGLRAAARAAKRVVVVGSGFIGMEAAASLRSLGCEVTIVTQARGLYERFGRELSVFAYDLFAEHGIEIVLHAGLAAIEGRDRVESVTLAGGRTIACEAVLLGLGVDPDTALARDAGLAVEDGIVVDAHLRTSAPGIFAAGDVARFPGPYDTSVRVEHFDHALESGRCAALNMATPEGAEYRYVPFFWSDLFDFGFEFVGEPVGDGALVDGSTKSRSFVIRYEKDGRLHGALLAGRTAEERDDYRTRVGTSARTP